MIDELEIETIGIWWLKEEITVSEAVASKSNETKSYSWWGICKKTRKVAFMKFVTNTLYELTPFIMNDILFSDKWGGCDDAKYCLNLDCPYNVNTKLITSIHEQVNVDISGMHNKENLVKYFESAIKWINENFIDKKSNDELNKIFVEDYSRCTITDNAIKTNWPAIE